MQRQQTTARPHDRWLLLIHQPPPQPASEQTLEDFQWTVREIAEGDGHATICEASFIEGRSVGEVEALFHEARGSALDAAFANGLEVTALHNHFFYDEPKVYFMHIAGDGDATSLARGVHAVWDAIRKVRRERPAPMSGFPGATPVPAGELDAEALGWIVGVEPAYFFAHFWGKGPATELAQGFRATLDAQRAAGSDDGH